MFTIEQIQAAHSKVQTGVDFPNYIQDLIKLGIIAFETYVFDGHTDYYGKESYKISSGEEHEKLIIADKSDVAQFKADIKAHQQGKTDYPTFCSDCAKSGVEKWAVSMKRMTCTYVDKAGKDILVEIVPTPK
jgi:uncharacterized protein YbcV (DUF1398 family)